MKVTIYCWSIRLGLLLGAAGHGFCQILAGGHGVGVIGTEGPKAQPSARTTPTGQATPVPWSGQ